MGYTECPCCGEEYDEIDDMRFRSGNWVDRETGQQYDFICERCHRQSRCYRDDVAS